MATYSNYNGTAWVTVGSTLQLSNPATQSYHFTEDAVFTDIPDNTSKLIYPEKLRNAILSLYDSVPFKENLVGNKYFIGIDNTNQNLKMPIYFGKRHYLGEEVVNTSILSANDITIYNTKSDISRTQYKTVMSFLTGTQSAIVSLQPSVEASQVSNNAGNRWLDLSIINPQGDINVLSKGPGANDPGGYVTINGITYSNIQDLNQTNTTEVRALTYTSGIVSLVGLTPTDPKYYGATNTVVPIYGLETYLNGYSLDFSDSRYCPVDIGDINLGENFSNRSIFDILERMVYGYLPPTCSLRLVDPTMEYPEIGSTPNISIRYEITKRSNDTYPTALSNMNPNQIPPIKGTSRTVSGLAKGIAIVPIEQNTTVFRITASDGLESNTATASITGVYPFFYGFTSSTIADNSLLRSIDKLVVEKKELKLDVMRQNIIGSDIFFFIYDYDYGPLSAIYDPFGSDIMTGRFISYDVMLSSPDGYWAQKKLRVYESNQIAALYTIGAISALFRFKF
jgi:hypothetical protein